MLLLLGGIMRISYTLETDMKRRSIFIFNVDKVNKEAREIGEKEFEFFQKMAENHLTLLLRNKVMELYEIN